MRKARALSFLFILVLILVFASDFSVYSARAWSNGGYSSDPSHPDYGTHDWIAQHALDWLPSEEKQYITSNQAGYLYGTELPDNNVAPDKINDQGTHHIYFNSAEIMTDDAAAVRASTEFNNALTFLKAKDYLDAAENAGIMSHYIADMAVFGHVMGSKTDWGAEVHHTDDYEPYVNARTSSYNAEFNSYLSFDGSLTRISAYDAARDLAYDTTFDVNGNLTCVWMDQNYNWNNPTFKNRAGESLNLAVNYLADVLHTLYLDASSSGSSLPMTTISPRGTLGNNGWYTSDVVIALSAKGTTEIVKTEYSTDNITWTSYTAPFTISNEGETAFYFHSIDKAGNIEPIRKWQVRIHKLPPMANAGVDQTVKVGEQVTFDGSNSSDTLGISSYEWNFGDNSHDTGVAPTHIYTRAGNYTVTLTAKNSAGNTNTDTLTVTVLSAAPEAFPMWIIGVVALILAILTIGAIAMRRNKT